MRFNIVLPDSLFSIVRGLNTVFNHCCTAYDCELMHDLAERYWHWNRNTLLTKVPETLIYGEHVDLSSMWDGHGHEH